MNRLANIALLVAVTAVAVASQRYFGDPQLVVDQPMGTSWEGEVVSVSSAREKSGLGSAMVKLTTGETVRATVPSGCVLFPGETTRLSKLGEGTGSAYMVTESGK